MVNVVKLSYLRNVKFATCDIKNKTFKSACSFQVQYILRASHFKISRHAKCERYSSQFWPFYFTKYYAYKMARHARNMILCVVNSIGQFMEVDADSIHRYKHFNDLRYGYVSRKYENYQGSKLSHIDQI